jgi:stress response protein YsnF
MGEQVEIATVLEHTGTVRVRKVSGHTSESVPLSGYQETVEVARIPINRPVDEPVGARQEADVLIVPVYEERVVKQLFLLEEIHLTRRRQAVQGNEVVHLRREDVIVERLDPATQQWIAEPG